MGEKEERIKGRKKKVDSRSVYEFISKSLLISKQWKTLIYFIIRIDAGGERKEERVRFTAYTRLLVCVYVSNVCGHVILLALNGLTTHNGSIM